MNFSFKKLSMASISYALVVLPSLFTFSTFSQTLERVEDRLILKDNNCDRLKRAQLSLKQWTEAAHKNRSCPPLNTIEKAGNTCFVEVTSCVPDHVKNYQGVKPEKQGPNCWNLSLVMKDILPALRYSTPEEMSFYMRPPLCRALKDNERRMPGDVGAIRGIYGGQIQEEIHGFIYISDDLVYSKNGYSSDSPYEVQPLESMFNMYEVSKGEECRKNSINLKSKCSNVASYFRCDSMDNYLKKQNKLAPEIKASLKSLNTYEQCFQKSNLDGAILSDNSMATIVDTTNALAKYVEKEFKKNGKKSRSLASDESRNFILGSIHLRIRAITEQLFLHESKEAEKAMELTLMFEENYNKYLKGK